MINLIMIWYDRDVITPFDYYLTLVIYFQQCNAIQYFHTTSAMNSSYRCRLILLLTILRKVSDFLQKILSFFYLVILRNVIFCLVTISFIFDITNFIVSGIRERNGWGKKRKERKYGIFEKLIEIIENENLQWILPHFHITICICSVCIWITMKCHCIYLKLINLMWQKIC